MISYTENGLTYEINQENFTATITSADQALSNINIPRTINYASDEYLIKSVGKLSFAYHKAIEIVTFSEDCNLEIIEQEAFTHSTLKSIFIPKSVTKICSKSFYSCEELFMVKFSKDSKLTIIEDDAFYCCNFKLFYIPPLVTRIGKYSFSSCSNLLMVHIDENSQLTSIGDKSFIWTPIVYFPPNLNELGEEWLCSTTNLNEIEISPKNDNFKRIIYKDNLMILGKSDQNVDSFDSLVFVTHKAKSILIPSYIKHIKSTAISGCEKLESVEFEKGSKLLSIDEGAFSHSSFSEIKLPSSLYEIKKNAFARCENLQKVEFENNSKLRLIGKHAFSFTSVESFMFPENVEVFEKEWCFYLSHLISIYLGPKNGYLSYFDSKVVIGKSNKNDDKYDTIIIARRDIDQIKIPSFIKYIKSCAFFDCRYLQKVEFAEDSELISIESYAFSGSLIKEITIPKHVKTIKKSAFDRCEYLKEIKFQDDSELKVIGSFALNSIDLESFYIPKNVEIIKKGFNPYCRALKNIDVSPENKNFLLYNKKMIICKSNSKIEFCDSLLFINGIHNKIEIPSFIKYIREFTFVYMIELIEVIFDKNSQLISIGFSAFSYTSIKSIQFPSSLKSVDRNALYNCMKLTTVEFLSDEISIDSSCFNETIIMISFPNTHIINIAYDAISIQDCIIFTNPYTKLIRFPSKVD